jgi:hypothetical protein
MTIPLPGSDADISQEGLSTAEKALGVWSNVDENDDKHLKENITRQVVKWMGKITNRHLTAKVGCVAYRFKLWPGILCGLATLSVPLEVAPSMRSHPRQGHTGVTCWGWWLFTPSFLLPLWERLEDLREEES